MWCDMVRYGVGGIGWCGVHACADAWRPMPKTDEIKRAHTQIVAMQLHFVRVQANANHNSPLVEIYT